MGKPGVEKRRREKSSQDKHLKLHCLTEDEIWPGQTNPFISTLGSGPRPSPWGTEILCLQWPALCCAQSKFLYRLIMNEWVHANSWFCLSQGHCPHLWFSPLVSSPISLAGVSVRARNQEGNYRQIKASPWPITECKQLWAWDSNFQLAKLAVSLLIPLGHIRFDICPSRRIAYCKAKWNQYSFISHPV